MRAWRALALAAMLGTSAGAGPGGPDVLVLGDSQLTFGAGVAFADLFADMAGDCGLDHGLTTGVIGVRSSAPAAWTATDRRARGAICDVDPKWRVNAGVYGSLSTGPNPYVQIGRDARFPFCPAGVSPLRAVFGQAMFRPRLVVMFFLGNAADRWAGSEGAAGTDARALARDLPPDVACVFMTTAPPYRAGVTVHRQRAQERIASALAEPGARCVYVAGITPETVSENQGNPRNFRRNAAGRVKDPYHPTEAAARRFLGLRRGAICAAVREALGRVGGGAGTTRAAAATVVEAGER